MGEDIKDIIEILELAKEDIENNNENITATLDLQDLKSLKNLLDLYQKEIEKKNKIIDKMAQELFIEIEPHFDTVEQCREYYTKIVEGEKKDG